MRRFVLALLIAGACGQPSPAPETAVVEPRVVTGPTLTVGEQHVYALAWHTEATRTDEHNGVSGGVALEGELAVSVLAQEPEGTRVSLSFASLPVRTLQVQQQEIPIDASMLLGQRAEILVGADGDVRRAFFDPSSPPIFRELMTGVIARLDLRGASTDGGPREIRNGHGLALATYHAGPKNVVNRELAKVVRFDTMPGVEVTDDALASTGRIELDDARVPTSIELHDSVAMNGETALVADDRFSLTRLRIDRADVVALADPVEIDPTAGPDMHAAALALDRQYAEGWTMQDVSIVIDTFDGGVYPRPGEFSKTVALLRGWPERADDIIPLAMQTRGAGRQLAFDMLSAAGTRRAQEAMVSLLTEPDSQWWPERALLVQRFTFVGVPTDETGEFLLSLLDVAETAGDDHLRRATLHPLGTIGGRIRNPWLAEKMHERLVTASQDESGSIRAGAIAGLGNAERPDDLARLLAATSDTHADVRVEAVLAMRFWVTPETTAVLLDALADENPAVGSSALKVLRKDHFDGAADPALVERARAGRYNPELDRAIASALVGEKDDAEVRAAIAAIAARTQDDELARALAETI